MGRQAGPPTDSMHVSSPHTHDSSIRLQQAESMIQHLQRCDLQSACFTAEVHCHQWTRALFYRRVCSCFCDCTRFQATLSCTEHNVIVHTRRWGRCPSGHDQRLSCHENSKSHCLIVQTFVLCKGVCDAVGSSHSCVWPVLLALAQMQRQMSSRVQWRSMPASLLQLNEPVIKPKQTVPSCKIQYSTCRVGLHQLHQSYLSSFVFEELASCLKTQSAM